MTLGGLGGDRAAVVTALRAVSGVADAEILPDPEGGPGTLRLQLKPGADEVSVARTVNRLLGEQFGLGVDSGRVQVVEEVRRRQPAAPASGAPAGGASPSSQPSGAPATPAVVRPEPQLRPVPPFTGPSVGLSTAPAEPGVIRVPDATTDTTEHAEPRPGTPPRTGAGLGTVADLDPVQATGTARGARLLIHRMQLASAENGVTSEVTLELSGTEHTGVAGAASTPTSVHRSVAQATLRAVEDALDGRLRFELEHLETAALGNERAILVEVAMITPRGSERLTGVSAVRDDTRQAVIRATLDAVNRRIETYLVSA
jgi:hypothetical protein